MSGAYEKFHLVACPWRPALCEGGRKWTGAAAWMQEGLAGLTCLHGYADFCAWWERQPERANWTVEQIPEETLRLGAVPAWLTARAEGRWPENPEVAVPERARPTMAGTPLRMMVPGQETPTPMSYKDPLCLELNQMESGKTAVASLRERVCSTCGGPWRMPEGRCYQRCWRAWPVAKEARA